MLIHRAFRAVAFVATLDGARVVTLNLSSCPSMPLSLVIQELIRVVVVSNRWDLGRPTTTRHLYSASSANALPQILCLLKGASLELLRALTVHSLLKTSTLATLAGTSCRLPLHFQHRQVVVEGIRGGLIFVL